jgi:uncharacterized protein involved in exopolysaccharide biosynthesis
VHSTSLIEIQAVADDATEARDIANAVAEAYRNYCAKDKAERLRSGLTVLQQNLDQQTARVRELGQRLEETRTRLGLEGWTDETADLNRSVEREQLSSLTQMATQAQSDYVLWSTKLSGLEKIGPDQLPNVLVTTVDNETILPRLLTDLQTVDQNLVKLRIDQADESPEVKRSLAMQSRIKQQIKERVAGIMAGLSNQVMAMRERCDALDRNMNENQKRVAEQTKACHEHRQLKRDLENEQRVRDALQLRVLQEQVDAEIPTVEIVDPAVLPLRPVRSASTLGGGLMGSGLLSFLAGLTLRFTARKPPAVA